MIYKFSIHEGAWARHANGEFFLCTVSEKVGSRHYRVVWFDDHQEATINVNHMKKLDHITNIFHERI